MIFLLPFALLSAAGCERTDRPEAATSTGSATTLEAAAPRAAIRTPEQLHAALALKNPQYNNQAQMSWDGEQLMALDVRGTGVVDLSPLAGLPLVEFYAEETAVTDLAPLKGMRLTSISLSDTPVADLAPLHAMPLVVVRLVNTKVSDLNPLRGAPLRELWINRTPVSDLSPLAGSPLVSLTIEGTRVRDLSVVRRLPLLERLHLAETPVDDLTPLEGLPLTRLVFTPGRIRTGLDAARGLPQCREFGVRYETARDLMPPNVFWAALDAGQLPR